MAPASEPQKKLTILRDYTENSNSSTHPPVAGPEWSYPNASLPCAFASDTKVRVTAKFEGCPDGVVYVKGDGPANYDLPTKLLVNGIYEATELTTKFAASKIDFFENFEIKWYFGATANGPWMEAGTSFNPLYVIRPVEAPDMDFYHTLLYYGCKYGKGHTTDVAIVDNIYNKVFGPKKLLRRDEPTNLNGMTYWGKANPLNSNSCWYTPALLSFEDGTCGAWADFMLNILKVQGIFSELSVVTWGEDDDGEIIQNSTKHLELLSQISNYFGLERDNVHIYFTASNYGNYLVISEDFFVNNFLFSGDKFYSWENEYSPNGYSKDPMYIQSTNNFLLFSPLNGAKAQGNENPRSTFENHAIIKYDGKYYDPSYGSTGGQSKNSWENISLAGFGHGKKIFFFQGNQWRQVCWLMETNNETLQTTIKP